ncbi:MAG: hypothetical protein IIZ96_04325, partial [Oscillospiraceae bacterium]|nr:hypothetical protein [Oscillospiraceae bacterium]
HEHALFHINFTVVYLYGSIIDPSAFPVNPGGSNASEREKIVSETNPRLLFCYVSVIIAGEAQRRRPEHEQLDFAPRPRQRRTGKAVF